MDQEDFWHTLTPAFMNQDRPAVFGPKDVSRVAVHSFFGSQDAGMYTRSEQNNFWDRIVISLASRNALKKFSQKLIVFSNNNKNPDSFPYYAPRTDFYVDNMISTGYFKDRFMDIFGPVASDLEHCGIYFSVFLLFKLIIDVVVMVIRHSEIIKTTGASLGFGKTILSASNNIFLMSILTSMYVLSDPEEDFQPLTTSGFEFPTTFVVTFLSPICSPSKIPSNPASPDETPISLSQPTNIPTTVLSDAASSPSTGLQFSISLPGNDQSKPADEFPSFSSFFSDV